jgi:FdrA protein
MSLQGFYSPLYTNVPLDESQALEQMHEGYGHTIIDFGADEFTIGRLHPMIDNELRIRRLREEAADPAVASILLDVVLGEGAHPDPASEFAPVIGEALKLRSLEIHVVILGTEEDRQDLASQELQFKTAGAHVYHDLQDALAALSPRFLQPATENSGIPIDLLTSPVTVINVGLESFYESVTAQGARAVHVDWKPPAGGNERMMDLLARVERP